MSLVCSLCDFGIPRTGLRVEESEAENMRQDEETIPVYPNEE